MSSYTKMQDSTNIYIYVYMYVHIHVLFVINVVDLMRRPL